MKVMEVSLWAAVILAWLQLLVVIISLIRGRVRKLSSGLFFPLNVAVIIPAYNEEQVIAAALLSWHRCSPRPSRLIVVDDGSTDATAIIVSAIKKELPILDLVLCTHMGKARALNHVLEQVDSDIIIISDADTKPNMDILRHLLPPFQDLSIVAVSANRRSIAPPLLQHFFNLEHAVGANLTRHMGNIWCCQIGVSGALSAFRRISLLAGGGYPEDALSDDTSVTLRLQEIGRVVFVPRGLAHTVSKITPQAALEQHRRWLLGVLQATACYGMDRLKRHIKPPFCLVYFALFRLLLPTLSPFCDYFILMFLVGGGGQLTEAEAIAMYLMYLLPTTLTGTISIALDRLPRSSVFYLPIAQLIVRQYTVVLLLYTVVRAFFRVPIRWGQMLL